MKYNANKPLLNQIIDTYCRHTGVDRETELCNNKAHLFSRDRAAVLNYAVIEHKFSVRTVAKELGISSCAGFYLMRRYNNAIELGIKPEFIHDVHYFQKGMVTLTREQIKHIRLIACTFKRYEHFLSHFGLYYKTLNEILMRGNVSKQNYPKVAEILNTPINKNK